MANEEALKSLLPVKANKSFPNGQWKFAPAASRSAGKCQSAGAGKEHLDLHGRHSSSGRDPAAKGLSQMVPLDVP